jgi:hypothetical protein
MRSYAHDCLRMHGNHPTYQPSTDLYKADRGAIEDRRTDLAKGLWMRRLREQMEANRCRA